MTPSWYPGKAESHRVVPTWNYAMVQVWGVPRVIDEASVTLNLAPVPRYLYLPTLRK